MTQISLVEIISLILDPKERNQLMKEGLVVE
jgi:hypothetical protein